MKEQWLVRTKTAWLLGPYTQETLREMILQQRLSLEDEVCCSQNDWISLNDSQALQTHLGVQWPQDLSEGTQELEDPYERDRATDPQLVKPSESLPEPEVPQSSLTEKKRVTFWKDPVVLGGVLLSVGICFWVFRSCGGGLSNRYLEKESLDPPARLESG